MNWIPRYLLMSISFLIGLHGFAQKGEYKYKRELQNASGQWHKIVLPDEIFSKINPDFSDVRIIGVTQENDTIEIPYILNHPAKEEVKKMSFLLMNESKTGQRYYFTFDAGESKLINEVDLDFKENNFDWKVRLEGSQNLQEWFSILDKYRIISIKNSLTDFEFATLTFPESHYRYYRISFESEEKPSLLAATLLRKQPGEGTFKNYPVISQTGKENSQLKQTILSISLKETVPVSYIRIKVHSPFDYYRPVTFSTLYDSTKRGNDLKYYYRPLISGILESGTSETFQFENTFVKDVKMIIENGDNQPLKIDSVIVSGYQYELTARFADASAYFLLYGRKSATQPDYDITRFVGNIPKNLSTLSIGKENIIRSEGKKASSLFENKNWLWVMMVLIIMTLGFFSASMIKKKK